MSKKELTTKNVVKAITLGLAAALATMTPMTDINAVVAFADDENSENQQDVSTKAVADYAEDAQDACDKVLEIESNTQKATEDAQQNAADIQQQIDNANQAVEYAEESKAAAQEAATAGLQETDEIETDIKDIKEDLLLLNKELNEEKQEFYGGVADDYKELASLVDSSLDRKHGRTDIIVSVDGEEGAVQVDGAAYVNQQAKAAEEALESVKESMELAQSFTSKEEVKLQNGEEVALDDVLTDIADAVEDASEAYNNAVTARDSEIAKYNELVREFNALVEEYGLDQCYNVYKLKKLPYYGEKEVNPEEVFFEGTTKKEEAAKIDGLVKEIKFFQAEELYATAQNLQNIEKAVKRADEAQKDAVAAAKRVIDSIEEASNENDEALQKTEGALEGQTNSKDLAHDNRGISSDSKDSAKEAVESLYYKALKTWYYSVEKLDDGIYSLKLKKNSATIVVSISGVLADNLQPGKDGKYTASVSGHELTVAKYDETASPNGTPEENTATQNTSELTTPAEASAEIPEITEAILMGEKDTFNAEFAQQKKDIRALENDINAIKRGATGVHLREVQASVSMTLKRLLVNMADAKRAIDYSNVRVAKAKVALEEAVEIKNFAQFVYTNDLIGMPEEIQRAYMDKEIPEISSQVFEPVRVRETVPDEAEIVTAVLGASRPQRANANPENGLAVITEDAETPAVTKANTQPMVTEVTFPEEFDYRPVVEIPKMRTPLAGEIYEEDEKAATDHFWAIMLTAVFGAIGAAFLKNFAHKKAEANKKPPERYR